MFYSIENSLNHSSQLQPFPADPVKFPYSADTKLTAFFEGLVAVTMHLHCYYLQRWAMKTYLLIIEPKSSHYEVKLFKVIFDMGHCFRHYLDTLCCYNIESFNTGIPKLYSQPNPFWTFS